MKWVATRAILGLAGHMDIFEAPDQNVTAKVVMIIRSPGHATTATRTAMPRERSGIVVPA